MAPGRASSAACRRHALYDWSHYNREFRRAARHGVRILPMVHGSPRWVARKAKYQPKTQLTKAALDAFVSAAAKRYGPNGSLWKRTPWSTAAPAPSSVRPVYWQIWNEPNTPYNWAGGPRPKEYAGMLKRVSRALKRAAPSARVMSAGLVWPAIGMTPELYMSRMLEVPGLRGAVDAFAVHPYGNMVFHVMQKVRSARRTLDVRGAASEPMSITEIGWGVRPVGRPHRPRADVGRQPR